MSGKAPFKSLNVALLATALVLCSLPWTAGHADELCRYDPVTPAPMPRLHIQDLRAIEDTLDALKKTYAADEILVVFDIDNTLLTSVNDFGSDAWFRWQDAIRKRQGCAHARVSADFGGLLSVQSLAFSVGDMRPTQDDTAELIRLLVEENHGVMALTARGPDIRSPTLRELREEGIAFPTAPACRWKSDGDPSLCARRGFISGDTILAVAEEALSERERESLGAEPRLISYADGVMMVAGQNKGLMLRLLLASSPSSYEAIVFVDDGADNVINVEEAFDSDETELVKAFWYTAFEEANADFWSDPERREETIRAWRKVRSALCEAVGTFCGP